jgi:hypothetical protein
MRAGTNKLWGILNMTFSYFLFALYAALLIGSLFSGQWLAALGCLLAALIIYPKMLKRIGLKYAFFDSSGGTLLKALVSFLVLGWFIQIDPVAQQQMAKEETEKQNALISEAKQVKAEEKVKKQNKAELIKEEKARLASLKKRIDVAIAKSKRLGFIMSLHPEVNSIYINPMMWAALPYDQKVSILESISDYCQIYCFVKGPIIHLKNGYSGEELASNSGLFGPKIKGE